MDSYFDSRRAELSEKMDRAEYGLMAYQKCLDIMRKYGYFSQSEKDQPLVLPIVEWDNNVSVELMPIGVTTDALDRSRIEDLSQDEKEKLIAQYDFLFYPPKNALSTKTTTVFSVVHRGAGIFVTDENAAQVPSDGISGILNDLDRYEELVRERFRSNDYLLGQYKNHI